MSIALVACVPSTTNDEAQLDEILAGEFETAAPPPLPENVATVVFADDVEKQPLQTASDEVTEEAPTIYWGVAEGEALTLLWEDLLPEGSEEALIQEYEQFYAMLDQRYAANSTSLYDAENYSEIAEGSELDFMPQLGTYDAVEALDEQLIRLPGYVVPFDFNPKKEHREFLFVPYMGACIHSPPPPPNQIILVRADPAQQVKDIWAPYWIEGTLHTESNENELGNTAYSLTLELFEPYPMP